MKINIHPGSDQKIVERPPKNLLEQWKQLPIDWVSVVLGVSGCIVVWALLASKCENEKPDFLDPICVVLPY